VQGLLDRSDKNKVSALILSVDEEWDSHAAAVDGMKSAMDELHVKMPCAVVPGGFAETRRLFGIDGYSMFLIGPDGSVKGTDLQAESVEELLAK
jgi:hypothetical protein